MICCTIKPAFLPVCITLFIAIAIVSCSSSNELKIAEKNFGEQIEQQQNLVFEFEQAVVPDSLTGLWDSTAYLRLTPAVTGSYKWTSPKTLVFSPSTGFKASTDYQAELTEALLHAPRGAEQQRLKLPTNKTLTFHTPYLQLSGADAAWTRAAAAVSPGAAAQAGSEFAIQLTLRFNYAVIPANVREHLHLTLDGKTPTFTIAETQPAPIITLIIPAGKESGGKILHVTLHNGLRCAESDYASSTVIETDVNIPATDEFKISQVMTDYDGDSPIIRVITTQSMDEPQILSFISLSPRPQQFKIDLTNNGCILRGNFQPDTSYQLNISRNLRGIFGVPLGADYAQTLIFGSMQPGISFVESKAMYLTSAGNRFVALRINGTNSIRLKVEKVYDNNILAYFRGSGYDEGHKRYYGYYDEQTGDYNGYEDYAETDDVGDPVFEKTYDVRQLPKQNGHHILQLKFLDKLTSKGVYVVRVMSENHKWLRDSKIIALSDIGLISKQSNNEMLVFAHSIKTAEPLSGVEVKLVTRNNQTLYKAQTDKDGVAKFSGIQVYSPGSVIAMVSATRSDETNYMLLKDTRVETSRFDVGGLPENAAGYQAFLYGDRDMYRPGETLRLHSVVRNADWEPALDVPVKIKLLLPNGKEYAALKQTLNKEGAADLSFPIPQAALTGIYTAEIYTMNDILLASKKIFVEEFMPDRISVQQQLSAKEVLPGATLIVKAQANNLFGPPAAGKNYNLEVRLARKTFRAKGLERYDFTINGAENLTLEEIFREGKTGEQGTVSETIVIPANYQYLGLLGGSAFVTIFDETGRPVHRVQDFDVPTQEIFYGIKMSDRYHSTKQALNIPLIAVHKSGKVTDNVQALVRVIRYNWITVLEKDPYGSRYRYVSQKQEITELEKQMTLSGSNTALSFTPRQSGEYEVRISKPGVQSYVRQFFYAYGWGDTRTSSFEVNKEGEITIEADKISYSVGETAQLLFKTPFQGKLLVTVERNKVLEYYSLNTDQKSATLALPIKEAMLPNVYVSATLFRPVDDGSMPLTVAYGYQCLSVQKTSNKIPVTISINEKIRSKTKQTITVATPESNVEMTIAVVDEGILQIRGFPTPDPYSYFYQKRALQVVSANVYPLLFPELQLRTSSVAGDAALARRTNPIPNKRVQLLAFWSGTLQTSGGKASFTIDVPEFSGALRVMAVAYKGKSFGSAEKTMRVADPIVISSAVPRFLSPGDALQMPVTLTNTTNKPAQVSAKLETKGNLAVQGNTIQTLTIPPNSEQTITFSINAAQSIGTGEVLITAQHGGETFTQKTELTIRPITSLLKYSGSGVISGGASETLALQGNFVSGTQRAKLLVSRSPVAQFAKNLSNLIAYPYGCVEQTISSVFPQLYLADLSKTITQQQTSTISANTQEAIRKLASMQLYNGSLAYWQGSTEESWWGSTYGAHFLIEAQRAGYQVQEQTQNRILGYLAKKVKERNYEWYGYYDRSGTWRTKYIPAKTLFYSLYVLAMANKPDLPTMNYYRANKDSLSLDSRYMLATAYFFAGDKAAYRSLLPKEFSGERSMRAFGGSFYSYVRDEAIALNALLEAEPDNPQIPMMSKHLSEALKTERYLNTQENAFALLALGKLSRRLAQSNVQAVVSANGKELGRFTGSDLRLAPQHWSNLAVTTSGNGKLYYFWETEGLSADGSFVEEDSYLRVRRTFLNRHGQPVQGETVGQNDLVVVKLSLNSTNGSRVENVVLTDMLPAGVEIENPRLVTLPDMPWIKDASEPQYLDVRDDRIHFFMTAEGTTKHYYYLCRAVSTGLFRVGPVSADAMYNGEYHSYHGSGTFRVIPRVTPQ